MSTSVPNSYSNNVTKYGAMIKGDDAFHEDDDDISLEGLDDDDISTIPDESICIVCCILTYLVQPKLCCPRSAIKDHVIRKVVGAILLAG